MLACSGVLGIGGGSAKRTVPQEMVGIGETTGIAVWKPGGKTIWSCSTPVSSAVVMAELCNPMSCFQQDRFSGLYFWKQGNLISHLVLTSHQPASA